MTDNTTCADCGAPLDFVGQIFCDTCRDNAALNDAARDYIRGGFSRGDAGDIFGDDIPETETETRGDALQEIARAATGSMRRDALGFWIPDSPC